MKLKLHFWLRLVLGGIFLAACADKLLNPADFAKLLYSYQILPDYLINMVAIALPWLELLLGLSLLSGIAAPGAVILANLLLGVFFGVLLFNLARGLNVNCGCFSNSMQGDAQTGWYVARDLLFLGIGGYVHVATFCRRKNIPSAGSEG